MWKGIAIGVGLVVESALCASAQKPDQSEETKRTLTQQFLDCVTSQVITIDDLTSDVAGIARGAVSLCKAEAHAAAVSKAGSQNELVPNLRASLEASGIETGIAALLKSRAAVHKQPVPRAPASRKPRPRPKAKQI
jgi:hypothetical protein